MTESWSFGRVFSAVASAVPPDAPALIHGDRIIDWGALENRTNALAQAFIAAGAAPGEKLAHLMRNSPAYLETTIAGFKARLQNSSPWPGVSRRNASNDRPGDWFPRPTRRHVA